MVFDFSFQAGTPNITAKAVKGQCAAFGSNISRPVPYRLAAATTNFHGLPTAWLEVAAMPVTGVLLLPVTVTVGSCILQVRGLQADVMGQRCGTCRPVGTPPNATISEHFHNFCIPLHSLTKSSDIELQ